MDLPHSEGKPGAGLGSFLRKKVCLSFMDAWDSWRFFFFF